LIREGFSWVDLDRCDVNASYKLIDFFPEGKK
jgi:hypothetical protein